jgi:hypothetical protein
MRESLLGFQIANQLASASFADRRGGKFDPGGMEVIVDVGHGRLFAHYEDLCTRQYGPSRQQRGRAEYRYEKSRTKGHGRHLV